MFYILIAICFVIGHNFSFKSGEVSEYGIVWNGFLFLGAFLVQLFANGIKGKTKKYAMVFAVFFSLMLIIGKGIYETNVISVFFRPLQNSILSIIMLVGDILIYTSVFSLISNFLVNLSKNNNNFKLWRVFQLSHIFYYIWALIFVSWVPAFLAYFPGIFSYDILVQTLEASKGISNMRKHHPPLHTMIWMLCMKLSDILGAEATTIYVLIQMCLLAFAFAKLIDFLIRKKTNNYLILFSICFVTLNPIVALFSIITVKDVFFTIFFILSNVALVELFHNPREYLNKRRNILYLCVTILLTCLLRNNAVYIFIILAIVYFIVFQSDRKKILGIFMIPIFTYLIISNIVYPAIGIEGTDTKEMLSVPIQQIANVIVTEDKEFPPEIVSSVGRYMPYQTVTFYNPRFADPLKATFQSTEFEEDTWGFFKVWGDLFAKYPDNYINAFLTLNIPYWYINATPLDEYAERRYIETANIQWEDYSVIIDSKLPGVHELYEKVADYSAFDEVFIISHLTSLSLPIWVLFFTMLILFVKNQRKGILLVLPSIIYWSTFLLGPVSNLRYIFPIIALFPFYVVLIIEPEKILE